MLVTAEILCSDRRLVKAGKFPISNAPYVICNCLIFEEVHPEDANGIGASRASLTSSMRLLGAIGLVTSLRRPGQRTVYYRMDDSAWENTLRRRIASMASFREVTRDGLALLGADKARAARIKAADDVYAWAEKIFAAAPPCPSAQPRFEAALNGRKQRSKS
ncbi:MAG: hypothetical protein WCD57_24235 [Acidobacteriaceae bacterium]